MTVLSVGGDATEGAVVCHSGLCRERRKQTGEQATPLHTCGVAVLSIIDTPRPGFLGPPGDGQTPAIQP